MANNNKIFAFYVFYLYNMLIKEFIFYRGRGEKIGEEETGF